MKLDISKVEFSHIDKKRNLKLPDELTEDLAYLIGVHIADGSMNIYKRKYKLDYFYQCTGHAVNELEWYKKTLLPLIKKIFNLSLKCFFEGEKTILFRFRSKGFLQFYNAVIGFPLGKKCSSIGIPEIVLDSPLAIKLACIKGIFDSDFSLSFKNKQRERNDYPVIKLSVRSKHLVKDVAEILTEVNFNYSTYESNVFDKRINKTVQMFHIAVSGRKNLDNWFTLIGSRNPNNITKYKLWKIQGYCQPRTNVLERQNLLNKLLSGKGENRTPDLSIISRTLCH